MLWADVARVPRIEARSERSVDAAAIGMIALVAVAIGMVYIPHSYDDAFITFRYARNFAMGNGFVYNLGERFIGTTAPLYGLILGLLAIPDPDAVPMISGVVSLL